MKLNITPKLKDKNSCINLSIIHSFTHLLIVIFEILNQYGSHLHLHTIHFEVICIIHLHYISTNSMYVYIDFLFFTINEYTMFFFCLIANDLNLPSQCHSYSVIQDESRNINAIGSNACDTMFLSAPTWVRFVSQSSTTELPTSPTNPNQCGTQVTGWYAGILPTIAQTINNGQVCFSWGTNNCQWSNTISVTNCGSFYVYQLTVPPVCSARYCTVVAKSFVTVKNSILSVHDRSNQDLF